MSGRRDGRYPLARFLGRCPSGQREQTVNLPAYAFDGSNPSRPTTASTALRARSQSPRVSLRSSVPSGRPASVQQALHHGHVEPAVELAADLALDADQLEPAARRAGPATRRRSPRCGPSRRGSRWPWRRRAAARAATRPTPRPVAVAAHVDRVLDGGAVGGPLLVGRQRGEADDLVAVDGDDGGEGTGAGGQPRPLVLQRSGHQVEGGRRGLDLEVVDGPDGLGVVEGGQARARTGGQPSQGRARRSRGGDPGACAMMRPPACGSAAPALLAQSAEHSHGKAGVVGSIPTEGSRGRPLRGAPAVAA